VTPRGKRVIIPVYHPAAITHNPLLKGAVFEDFRIIGTMLGKRQRGGKSAPGLDAQSTIE
jgi:uracil-DNA glycosylase